uniref:Tensin 1 n=1 Tax=Petromyzon marinus TaxID=7757 RepID=S4RZF9_PETMA
WGVELSMEGGRDLELTYITERIISLCAPTGGDSHVAYHQQMRDVARMLHSKHANGYLVINLSERRHDIEKFNVHVRDFGWPDLHAPPLDVLCSICKAMDSWLNADPAHVVVIHCKGNKCRTGVVVASYMYYNGICASASQALDRYAMKKFYDDKVAKLSQPSQRRYVSYFSELLSGRVKVNNLPLFLHHIVIHGLPNLEDDGGCRPFLKIYQAAQPLHTSAVYNIPNNCKKLCITIEPGLPLKGDILVKCYHRGCQAATRDEIFRVQFHTCVVQDFRPLVLGKSLIKSFLPLFSDEKFPDDGRVEFIFSSGPEKPPGGERYMNAADIGVDFGTADPLIRCDSYENFNVRQEDSLKEVPHTEGPVDGSLYARIKKKGSSDSGTAAPSVNGISAAAAAWQGQHNRSMSTDSGNSTASTKTERIMMEEHHHNSTNVSANAATISTPPVAAGSANAAASAAATPSVRGGSVLSGLVLPAGSRHVVPVQVHVNGDRATPERETDILDDDVDGDDYTRDAVGTLTQPGAVTEKTSPPGSGPKGINSFGYSASGMYPGQGNPMNYKQVAPSEEMECDQDGSYQPPRSPNQHLQTSPSQTFYGQQNGSLYSNPVTLGAATQNGAGFGTPQIPERSNSSRHAVQRTLSSWQSHSRPLTRQQSDVTYDRPTAVWRGAAGSASASPHGGPAPGFPDLRAQEDFERSLLELNKLIQELDPTFKPLEPPDHLTTSPTAMGEPQIRQQMTVQSKATVEWHQSPGCRRIHGQPPRSRGGVCSPQPGRSLHAQERSCLPPSVGPRHAARRPSGGSQCRLLPGALPRRISLPFPFPLPQYFLEFSPRQLEQKLSPIYDYVPAARQPRVPPLEWPSREALPQERRAAWEAVSGTEGHGWEGPEGAHSPQKGPSCSTSPSPCTSPELGGSVTPTSMAVLQPPGGAAPYTCIPSLSTHALHQPGLSSSSPRPGGLLHSPCCAALDRSAHPGLLEGSVQPGRHVAGPVRSQRCLNFTPGAKPCAGHCGDPHHAVAPRHFIRARSHVERPSFAVHGMAVVEDARVCAGSEATVASIKPSTEKLSHRPSRGHQPLPGARGGDPSGRETNRPGPACVASSAIPTPLILRPPPDTDLLHFKCSGLVDIRAPQGLVGTASAILHSLSLNSQPGSVSPGSPGYLPSSSERGINSPNNHGHSLSMAYESPAQSFKSASYHHSRPTYSGSPVPHGSSSVAAVPTHGAYSGSRSPGHEVSRQYSSPLQQQQQQHPSSPGWEQRQQQQQHHHPLLLMLPERRHVACGGSGGECGGLSPSCGLPNGEPASPAASPLSSGPPSLACHSPPPGLHSASPPTFSRHSSLASLPSVNQLPINTTEYSTINPVTLNFYIYTYGCQIELSHTCAEVLYLCIYGSIETRAQVKFVQDTTKYWYKKEISRDQAIALLKDKEPGSFVIRDSHSFRGAYGLAMKVSSPPPNIPQQGKKKGDVSSELVRHYLIECTSKGVRLKGCPNEPYFGSLSALVYQHSITPLALPCKIVIPHEDPLEHSEVDSIQSHPVNATPELLKQGAACNVLYLGSVEMESLTGPQAVAKAVGQALSGSAPPSPTQVHFKVSQQGVTLTDNQRKLFFRRHYPADTVTYCDQDPQNRKWKKDSGSSANIFGFVAKKQGSVTDNQCHLFAELDPKQPASAIVSFITKVMMSSQGSA